MIVSAERTAILTALFSFSETKFSCIASLANAPIVLVITQSTINVLRAQTNDEYFVRRTFVCNILIFIFIFSVRIIRINDQAFNVV
jgi:hypothetical protein